MKKVIIMLISIIILSGCLTSFNTKDNIKIKNNNENIKIQNHNITERKILKRNTYNKNIKYGIKTKKFTNNYINISLKIHGTESGCYYNYKDINNINISKNQIKINMQFKKEPKDKKRGFSFSVNCEEYAKPIIINRNIKLKGNNLKKLKNIHVDYNTYNKTIKLK